MNIDILKKWCEVNKDNYIDVIIAGRVFGGRHGESPQLPRAFSYKDDILKVKFSTTGHLTVINPTNFILGQYSQLLIPVASKAVWGWHYYGRPKTEENWCEEIYNLHGKTIEFQRSGALMPSSETFIYNDNKFIELR